MLDKLLRREFGAGKLVQPASNLTSGTEGPVARTVFTPTPEQQKVISHRGGHLQVIACAGAGKTEAISRRVSSLIEEGGEPRQIVAFTFTKRAAESLKTRITKRIEETEGPEFLDRLGTMFVGTILSYCLRLLQDHVPEFGNLLLEIKGYEVHNPEQTHAKHNSARKWVTAGNNLADFGKWTSWCAVNVTFYFQILHRSVSK